MKNIILLFTFSISFLIMGKSQNQNNIQFEQVSYICYTNADTLKNNPNKDRKSKKASRLYKHLAYRSSIELYKKLKAKNTLEVAEMEKLANAYRLNSESEDAAFWYSKFIHQTQNEEHYLHYAQVLQSNGNCNDAKKWFNKYKTANPSTDFELNNSCAELVRKNTAVQIKNIEQLNSPYVDFSPVPYKNGVVFTSTRSTNKITNIKDSWTEDHFCDLFYAEKNDQDDFNTPTPFSTTLNKLYHDGSATFSSDGTTIIFSRSTKGGRLANGNKGLQLYTAILKNGSWTAVKALSFNEKKYTFCHPTLSVNGKYLYFASDKKGGFGGMDLYVSQLVDDEWQEPQNLGASINTSGNELFPFVSEEGELYFSSNNHRSIGGLDIFKTQQIDSEWQKPQNLGAPFNSKKDDFSFSMLEGNQEGYFASNRVKGMGKDDIYAWSTTEETTEEVAKETKPKTVDKLFRISDANSLSKINSASIVVLEIATEGNREKDNLFQQSLDQEQLAYLVEQTETKERIIDKRTMSSDLDGAFYYTLNPSNKYILYFQKNGYTERKMVIYGKDIAHIDEPYTVLMSPKKEATSPFNWTVVDKEKGTPISGANVKIIETKTGKVIETKSSSNGSFTANLICQNKYKILTYKNNFEYNEYIFSYKDNSDCNKIATSTIEMKPIKTKVETKVITHFLGDKNRRFKVGQKINVENIYYDYNAANIRPDARQELDRIVELMNTYPTMEIDLTSHTDSRGKTEYNQSLSSKRAQSAVQYIISRGISSHRIKAIGYGESNLVNNCGDGQPCSEIEHQQNRRTEIVINKL